MVFFTKISVFKNDILFYIYLLQTNVEKLNLIASIISINTLSPILHRLVGLGV